MNIKPFAGGLPFAAGQKTFPDVQKEVENSLAVAKRDSYNEVMTHEMQHKAKAGPYGGPIVIQYDGKGIATGGYVPITFTALDAQSPESSLQAYRMIRDAALAPGDPSSADRQVAAKAMAMIGKAQVLMDRKKQQAGSPKDNGNGSSA